MENNIKNIIIRVATIVAVLTLFLMFFNKSISFEYKTIFYVMTIALVATFIEKGTIKEELEKKEAIVIVGLSLLLFLTPIILSSTFINADYMSKALKVENKVASDLIIKNQRTVTKNMAIKIANKILGKKVDGVQISSQYQLNPNMASVQVVNGELKWIIPLDYSSFIKYFKQNSIPGYVEVSATNPLENAILNIQHKMIVSENSLFMDSVKRIMYINSGFKKVETHFEVDEKGNPYFVGLVQIPERNFINYKTTKVLLLNAVTGELKKLSKEQAKKEFSWIDRLESIHAVEDRIEWYGALQQGWLNTIIGGENINKPTTYNNRELWFVNINGRNMLFTGMTSENSKDSSLVQGIAVDTITGEGISFDLSGAMDEKGAVTALDSGLGADSQKWEPVLPQPFIKNGKFYWGCSIVSNSGIFQKTGIVNAYQQGEIYYAKTFEKALNKIGESLSDNNVDNTETITVNKAVYLKLLKKIEEINQLKNQLTE